MPKERYNDRELLMLAKAAAALEDVMSECKYRDLLYGKWALMTEDIRQEHTLRARERAEMFVSPERQLCNLIRWNGQRGWGFSEDDISDLAKEVPPAPPPPEKGKLQLKARVLEIHLPDGADGTSGLRRTWNELCDIARSEHGAATCHLFDAPKARITLAPGRTHYAGLHWRIIDLGGHWPEADPNCRRLCGTSPHSLGARDDFPDAGLLAAAAHFPLWLKRMDGKHVPYVWLPGYRVEGVPHGIAALMREPVVHHPYLTRNGAEGNIFVYFCWDYVPFENVAVPIYADSKTDP